MIHTILKNVAATQTGPQVNGIQVAQPPGAENPMMPPAHQQFQLTVSGIGNVSATVNIVGSNDEANFVAGATMQWVGVAQITANGVDNANEADTEAKPYKYWSAYVTAISGTSAKATLTLSA